MSNILDLFPDILQDFQEIKVLADVENQLLEDLKECAKISLNNQFIKTADENVIKQFEKYFKIKADVSESLNFRRERIINRLSNVPPFTYKYLERKLTELLGENAFEIEVDNFDVNFRIKIWYKDFLKEAEKTLIGILPANLNLNIDFAYNQYLKYKNKTHLELSAKTHGELRSEI